MLQLEDGVRSETRFFSASGHCPGNAFTCGNSQCVTKVNPECDDKVDCSDGSDEAHCGQSACLAWSWAMSPSQGQLLAVLWSTLHSKAKCGTQRVSLNVGAVGMRDSETDMPGAWPQACLLGVLVGDLSCRLRFAARLEDSWQDCGRRGSHANVGHLCYIPATRTAQWGAEALTQQGGRD